MTELQICNKCEGPVSIMTARKHAYRQSHFFGKITALQCFTCQLEEKAENES